MIQEFNNLQMAASQTQAAGATTDDAIETDFSAEE